MSGPYKQFCVEIVRYDGDAVIKRYAPTYEPRAERIEDGININLDHDKYYTRVVEFTDDLEQVK